MKASRNICFGGCICIVFWVGWVGGAGETPTNLSDFKRKLSVYWAKQHVLISSLALQSAACD